MNSRPLAILSERRGRNPERVIFQTTFQQVARLYVDRIARRFTGIVHPYIEVVPVVVNVLRDLAQSQIADHFAKTRHALRAGVRRIAHALNLILKIAVATFAHNNVGDGDAAARLQHSHHFRERAHRIGHVVKRVAAGNDFRSCRLQMAARRYRPERIRCWRCRRGRLRHALSRPSPGSGPRQSHGERARPADACTCRGRRRRRSREHFPDARGPLWRIRQGAGFVDSRAAHGLRKDVRGFREAFANFFEMTRFGDHIFSSPILPSLSIGYLWRRLQPVGFVLARTKLHRLKPAPLSQFTSRFSRNFRNQDAARAMLGTSVAQIGHGRGAFRNSQRAARLKRATWRQRGERRHLARNRLQLVPHELRRSAQQARCVRMTRMFEHLARRTFLHNAARVGDSDAIRDLRDNA